MGRENEGNSTDEIEITPEMIEAGVSVIDDYLGPTAEIGMLNLERPEAVHRIFLEMYKVANPRKCNQ
jgi:hypothetical protein